MEKVLSGRGFVLFAGVLSNEKDKDGNFKLDFVYTRHHYPFEDLPRAITAFREHGYKDAIGIFGKKES